MYNKSLAIKQIERDRKATNAKPENSKAKEISFREIDKLNINTLRQYYEDALKEKDIAINSLSRNVTELEELIKENNKTIAELRSDKLQRGETYANLLEEFKKLDIAHKKASAILRCLSSEVLADARQYARDIYPQLPWNK